MSNPLRQQKHRLQDICGCCDGEQNAILRARRSRIRLIHWLPLHGHGVGRVTGDCLQMAAPALRQCWVTYIHLVSGTFILLNWQQRSLNNPSGRSHTCTQQSVQPCQHEGFATPLLQPDDVKALLTAGDGAGYEPVDGFPGLLVNPRHTCCTM